MRYYDPEIGRYISRDPAGYVDGLNVYLYVGNNPVNKWDPEGLLMEYTKGQEETLKKYETELAKTETGGKMLSAARASEKVIYRLRYLTEKEEAVLQAGGTVNRNRQWQEDGKLGLEVLFSLQSGEGLPPPSPADCHNCVPLVAFQHHSMPSDSIEYTFPPVATGLP